MFMAARGSGGGVVGWASAVANSARERRGMFNVECSMLNGNCAHISGGCHRPPVAVVARCAMERRGLAAGALQTRGNRRNARRSDGARGATGALQLVLARPIVLPGA